VKSFFVFLTVIIVIGLVWAIKPILDNRAHDHEQRLVASLDLVEEAIVSSSTDILRVDLFSPEIARLSDDGRWRVSGILETQNHAGKAVFARYVAAVAFTCTPYGKTGCGKIETLSIDDQPLVIDGAIVAELQSVLGTITDALSTTLPGTSVTSTASSPGLQLETTEPEPALEPGVPTGGAPTSETPTSETPTSETPTSETPTSEIPASEASEPVVTAVVPTPAPTSDNVSISEPIQGNRQIFLIQKNLRQLGYDPGPVDGQVGPRTTSAIRAYQQQAGLAVDGQPSAALLEHIAHAAE